MKIESKFTKDLFRELTINTACFLPSKRMLSMFHAEFQCHILDSGGVVPTS